MGMISEFKEFAMKGNMMDMAVGIILGAAFGTVIKSLVNDVLMPVVGNLLGGVDFADMKIILAEASEGVNEVAISYGLFMNAIIAFLIVAFVLFMLIKNMNKAKKAEEEAAPAAPPANEVLLAEIRDLLKKKK